MAVSLPVQVPCRRLHGQARGEAEARFVQMFAPVTAMRLGRDAAG
jgi:hypothetical protein